MLGVDNNSGVMKQDGLPGATCTKTSTMMAMPLFGFPEFSMKQIDEFLVAI